MIRSRLRNFFRIRQPLTKSQYIQVEQPRQIQRLDNVDNNVNGQQMRVLIERIHYIETKVKKCLGLDTNVITVPVQHGSTFRYFDYHSARYVYQEDKDVFEHTTPDIEFSQEGLSSKNATDRLERIGPNFIHVHVPSFFYALWEE